MSQPVSPENLLSQILWRDIAKAVRTATIFFILNALIIIFAQTLLSTIFTSYTSNSLFENTLEVLAAFAAVYAVMIYSLTRFRRSRSLASHFYVLGVLGLCVGGLFFAWGAVEFLSSGYWLRQYAAGPTDPNGGAVAAYGTDKLVNLKTSKLIRIGYTIPSRWRYSGVGLLVAGAIWYIAISFLSQARVFIFGQTLFVDGIVLVSTWYTEQFYGGRVRLPDSGQN